MSGAWLLVFYLLVPLEAYLGVTNVTFVDTASVFGFIGGVISWTPPSDLTHVTGYRAWLGVNEDSELADFFNGLGIFAKGVWDYKVSASSTQIEFDPIEPLATITRERCRYLQVYAELDGAWQTRADLLDGADILFYDRGWTGTSLPFTQQDVSFVDTDLRCGFLGGAVRFALRTDPTALKYWRVYFSDDLQGSNPSTEFQLPMSFSNSVTLPGDYQHGTRTVLNIAGVNDDIELTVRIPFQDDCGGVPEVVFTSLSFDDQDPGQELISGTVHVDLPLQYSDQYTALRLYLAYDGSGLGRTQIGAALAPFEFQFTVAAGTRLDSRDYLLVYAENAYGEQPLPVSLLVKDYVLWPEAPGESSVVQSIQFQDEDNIYGKLDGLVKWVPGSMTVTTYFVVFVATDSGAEVQVSPEVPADAAHEWHITVTLDTSGEPYTQLLVYAGNNVGLSNYSSAIPLEDGRTTCTSATYWPCARFQVLKEAPPVGCAADFCTAEECCTAAGLCWDFFAGAQNASDNATDVGPGCAEGFVARAAPPEFCAGPICSSTDCCLRRAEPVVGVQLSAGTYNSAQVLWDVPQFHDCVFAEYQVQVQSENTSWQEAQGCGELRDSCSFACTVQDLPSLALIRTRVRAKCYLIGAEGSQDYYTPWAESGFTSTSRMPPAAPANMLLSARYETEVLYTWQEQDLGPDCTFEAWLVQIREESSSIWITLTECAASSAACNVRDLKCDTSYSLRVAATCQEPDLVSDFSTTSFRTKEGDSCLLAAGMPGSLSAVAAGPSAAELSWEGGSPNDCSFLHWDLQLRAGGGTWLSAEGCEQSPRLPPRCTATGLMSSTAYEFRLRERCLVESTWSPWSDVALARTAVAAAESPGLSASVTSFDEVQLTWTQPQLNDCIFLRYQVQWAVLENSTDDSELWHDASCQELGNSCTLGCQVFGLPSRSPVAFRGKVRCTEAAAESPWSSEEELVVVDTPGQPMGAPQNVTVSDVTAHEAYIFWRPGVLHDCDFQRWQLQLQSDSDWYVAEACSKDRLADSSCHLQGLPCSQQFRLRISGVCSESSSGAAETSFATPLVAGCLKKALAPSLVEASDATASEARLAWRPAEELENCTFLRWEVEVQPENQATWAPAQGCEHLETRDNSGCEVSQLQSFTAHWFRVREVCNESSFTSDWAVSAPVTTALVRSEAVQNLTAEPLAPGELSLSWQVPPLQSCGFQGYQVQWREQQGDWSSASCGATLCQSSCRLSVPSNRLVEVQVKVSCSPSEADSDWSGLLVETLPVPAAAVQNLMVSNIHAAGGDLSWTPGPMNDCVLSSWHLGYRDLLGSWTSTSCAADVPCSLSGLACDTAYELRVAASCADFRADGPFVTASFTTDPGDVCLKESPAPRSVAAISLGVSSLSVSWEDVEPGKNCSFQQWQVEVRPSNSDTWRLAAGCAGLARTATSCVATGLQSMMAHSFRVREDCGLPADWGYSSPASTEARPAMAPFDVVATPASDSAMTVQWSTPELNDCVFRSFELQWADVGGSWVSSACDGTFCQSSCLAQPLPSNTLLSFRVRTLCDVEALSSSWSNASDSVATLPRIAEVVVVNISASHDTAELTWERPLLNDCLLLGYKVEISDGLGWAVNPGCNASEGGCILSGLSCGTAYEVRAAPRCSDHLAEPSWAMSAFTTSAGADCARRAGKPAGVLLLPSSVSSLRVSWEAGSSNDCTFASWRVLLGPDLACEILSRAITSCFVQGLTENTSYHASVQEFCEEPALASPIASGSPATTYSVPAPSIALQIPTGILSSRATEIFVLYDVDVEPPEGMLALGVCGCSSCLTENATHLRNWRVATWPVPASFWQQGCTYEVQLPEGILVTRQKPSKNSPELSWSFLFQIPSAELTQPLQVLSASTETVSFSLAWSASVVFSCRAGANHSAPQLAARNVLAVVHLGDLHPDSHYEVECQATLQDEPDVVSEWPAGHVQTATDYSVQLDALSLRVQPLCPSNPLHAYDMPVVPTLEANRSDYSVALPNADFALNCTASEATWQLELHAAASSSYASVAVSWNQTSQESELPIMMLPADQVVVTTTFRVAVEAGCRCRSGLITVQVMGLRLSFELGDIEVTRSTGDPVSLQEVDEGQKLEVVVTYSNEALPAELWGQLAFYLGPFPQATLAAPRPDLETDARTQVYMLMTTLSAVGKDLALQLRIAGAVLGEATQRLSFAQPLVSCISTSGYGQCSTDEMEKREVLISTLGESLLYVKGQGFGSHELLAGSGLIRLSVTQLNNNTELCEASGWVSYTEMWCRLAPKGATPLAVHILGPNGGVELLEVPWVISYRSPTIDNFSQPTLQIKDGGQMYIIGTNFPDFQDDSGVLTYESGEDGARRLRELQGISTSEVCTNLVRVNETHLLCELKPRIDLTPARCRDVEIVVAWGSLKTHMQSVPLRLPEPLISEAHDVTPNQPWPVEVGEAILYRLEGLNFGNWENGKIQVMVGDRTCAVSGREDTNVLCTTAGPLRDDLQDLYPETPENNSFGDVEVVIPMPIWLTMGASATEASEDCEPLAANWSYQVRLKSCPAGQFRQSHRSDTCAECSPGHFSPVAGPFLSCLDCGEASYANLPGAFACLDCPAGRLTGKNATASALDCKCAPGRFLAQAPRRAELSVLEAVKRNAADFLGSYQLEPCESCPSGSTCAGALAPPVANPGWWMMSGDLPVRCTLGGCLGNNTCAPGYDARTRCETCTVTFYMDLMESACKQCEDWVAFFAIIYGCAAFVLLFGFVFPFISWKSRVALDPGRGVAPPKLCFGLCHCCLRRFAARRRLLRADYVDMSQYQDQLWKRTRRVLQKIRVLYHSPMRRLVEGAELQPLVNILLNNVQTFVLLANIGYRSWPAPTKFILDLGLLMVSNVESLRPACVAPIGADGRWYLLFSLPYLLYASCILFVLCRQRESSRRRRVMLMISGGFTLYLSPVFLLTAAAVFDCVDSGDGSRVLDLDRSIVCWGDGVWKQMFALAVLQFLLLALLLAFVGFSVYRSYMWYRVAEVGMQPPSAVFLTWWWLAGSRGISLKHRAAIQGYKVHLDLPSNLTQASEVSSLCDDLLLQNVGNLKSGIERLKDYLQGFRVDDVDALKRPRRRGQNVCEHCQGCGKSMHDKHQHQHQHVEVGCGFCGRGKEDPWQMRSSMRKAAYSRLSLRLEQLLLQLRTMSSFSETSASLNDLFAFMWELLVLVHKTSLGTVRLLVSQDARSGLQISLLLCVAYLGLALVVKPYRHDGLNWLEGYFAVMKVVLVFTMVQLDDYGENTIVTVFCMTLVALALASVLLMLPAWGFYALWRSAFTESFYVMVTEEVQGQNWRGPSSPREQDKDADAEVAKSSDLANPVVTRVVRSSDELLAGEPLAAQWCFRCPQASEKSEYKDHFSEASAAQRVDLTLEQGMSISVREPSLLLHLLNSYGNPADLSSYGLQLPVQLRRGGDLRGRLRITVPCNDQKLLRSTLRQLNALSERTETETPATETGRRDTEESPRGRSQSASMMSSWSQTDTPPASEMAPRWSTVTSATVMTEATNATQATQASNVTRRSTVGQKPGCRIKALSRAAKIGGRLVPAGAVVDSIRYVPPGTRVEDSVAETPEDFLNRLSRGRFSGKGGILRDARGVLILEFQRPEDPLDVHMELAELVLSRDEVPQEQLAEGTLDCPAGMRIRQKVEWTRSVYTERAKALVWEVGDFVLPLDVCFSFPVEPLQLQVCPKPDWGCMQQVLVLNRGGQQWLLQAQELHHHLGLSGEAAVKRRKQKIQEENTVLATLEDESSEDELFEDEMELERAAKRTGKGSGSEGHFGARSAWRTKSGGVVFVHDFSCFGGTLELVGRPQDIKAVEKGELLGQQVLWHPPKPRRLSMKEKPEGSTASTEEPPPEPLRGWFDGNTLFWEPKTQLLGGVSEAAREVHSIHEAVGVPMDGELPPGPWRRITSALEPEGVPGPDGGLWRLQMAFYADCHGPLPLEYLEKLGAYQAGPGARELYLRSRRDARPQDTEAAKTEAAEQDEWLEEWQSEEEDYPLEALGLVDVSPKAVAFEDIMPNLQRGSAPRLQTFDS